MKVLQHSSDFSGLASRSFHRKAIDKIKSSSLPGYSVRFHNVKLTDNKGVSTARYRKRCHMTLDHAQLFSSPVTACRKCVLSVASSQSCPDCDLDSYNAEERLIHKSEQRPSSMEEMTIDLGNPSSGSQPRDFRSELTVLAVPAILGQAIDPLAQLMETAYIGRLGSVELASAGVSVSIFNIVSKLFNVPLLSITTSFVAEDISKITTSKLVSGNGTVERQKLPSVSTALVLAVGIGMLEALALFCGSGLFLHMMGISVASPMRNPAQQFLYLRALGAPANVVSLAVQGVFRGFKDTKTPLFCVGLGNLSAVFLLPILMYSIGLGVTGAAIATVASQYIATFLLLWRLSRRAVLLPPKIEDLEFGGYIKSGGLLLGRTLSVLFTMTLATSMAARQGPLAMAAHQICLQVWLAVSLLSDALALSAQALIASSFAKHEYKRVKDITYFVLKTGVVIGIILAIILGTSFGSLAKLFSKDAEVLQIVKTGVLFVSASQPINALAFVFDGLHYGVSDFSYSACSMMLVGLLSSLFLLYAPSLFGLPGVWSGLTLFMSLRMAAGFLRLQWKTGPWWFLKQEPQVQEVAN